MTSVALLPGEILLLYVGSAFGVGFLLARRMTATGVEKITLAAGLSFIVLYPTSFAIFVWDLPREAHFAISAIGLVGLLASRRDLYDVLSASEARRCLGGFAFVVFWIVLLVALIRSYSGGGWSGDWLEHYQRAIFFLDRLPPDTRLIDFYWLPARPPLMNLVCASFLAQLGRDFAVYQVVMVLVNATVFLPVYLLARRFAPVGSPFAAPLIAFLVLNPMFVENLTYGWTRPLTNFFVLGGIYAYATARETGEPGRYTVAWVSLAAAVLTHYSAVPYVVFLALHFAFVVIREGRVCLGRATAIGTAAVLLMVPWIGWSLWIYGWEITVGSNTTAMGASGSGIWDQAVKVFDGLWTSFVPHPLRGVDSPWIHQRTLAGYAKDSFFLMYQTNLMLAAGSAGIPLLLYEVRRAGQIWVPLWSPLVSIVVVVSLLANYDVDPYGSAHVCLQPLILIWLARLSVGFPHWPKRIRAGSIAALLVDLALGIALLLWFEHQIPTEAAAVAAGGGAPAYSLATYLNWNAKMQSGVLFLGDHFSGWAPVVVVILGGLLAFLIGFVWRTRGVEVTVPAPLRPCRHVTEQTSPGDDVRRSGEPDRR